MKFPTLLAAVLAALSTAGSQQARTITFDDFAAVRAVSDPQPSPDGKQILYTVRTTDVAANSRSGIASRLKLAGGADDQHVRLDVGDASERSTVDT